MDTGIPLEHFLILAALLFGIGLFGVLARKNAIAVLMGIELMLNAVNINFLAFAREWGGNITGAVFAVFIIAVAAAEAAVALAIVIALHRRYKNANVDEVDRLKN